MRTIALTALAIAAAGMAGCQGGTANNSANGSVDVNGAAIGQSIENGLNDAGNMASDAGNTIGNTASRAGDVIENNAKAAWNEVKETGREILGDNNSAANTSTNKTGR